MKPEISETISIEKQAQIVYVNIRDAHESGMTHWKETFLVSWRGSIHPMVKEHVKFLIIQNKKNETQKNGKENK